ncbi:hypothetical protein HPP92_020252 [Vanilla planifolia]|uniref:Uncharacterized protein n=1 Tax=Vanilla planifolia TaxID=51239 RepID=A0A835Q0C8_VANPL|nr:hypothetical protein HPP92_020660 [Vanilla planifolia]KAG0461776.1 hypothetical protein HPP92_020252 [Vanilla planifolia]
MTAREFAELVSRARDGSRDDYDGGDGIARLVMEGCSEGRWVAVDCVAEEAESGGRRTALKTTAALGPIAEE